MAEPPAQIPGSAVRGAQELRAVFARLYRQFKGTSRRGELTPAQGALLSRLGKDGEASPGALAAAEGVRAQAVGQILTALRAQGLVEQRPDPADGRRQIVSLSATGRDLVDDSRRAGDEWLTHRLADRFSEAERRTLLDALALLDRLL
jgi:DNA-binding MarR family transcriptional regulator